MILNKKGSHTMKRISFGFAYAYGYYFFSTEFGLK